MALPALRALVLTPSVPAVSSGGGAVALPAAASLTLTAFAPAVVGSQEQQQRPSGPRLGELRANTFVDIRRPVLSNPAAVALRIVTFRPAVQTNDDEVALLLLEAA